MRWAASSFSKKVAVPRYVTVIGPTRTFTEPFTVSPSNSSTVAPGMHCETCSMSSSARQASSTGTGTVNEFCSCMVGSSHE